MQENEFEKQIKRLMDGLHLRPSDDVWDKISHRLIEKRRRKTPFIFLLAISLLTTGYFIFHVYEKNTHHAGSITGHKNNPVKANDLSIKDPGKLSAPGQTNAGSTNNKTVVQQDGKVYNKRAVPGKVNNTALYTSRLPVNESVAQQNNNLNNYEQQDNLNAPKQNDTSFVSGSLREDLVPIDSNAIADTSKTVAGNSSIENKSLTDTISTLPVQNRNDSPFVQPAKKINKGYKIPAWQWGITAFYGKSNIVGSLLDFNKSARSLVSNPSNGGYDTVVNNSHPFSASGAYQFGGVVQKKIIKNGFLSAGISFIHLSMKANINRRVDSSVFIPGFDNTGNGNFFVSQYYQPGSLKDYTSSYNFIELPLYFQQDIFPARRISFSYNAGVSMRQLLSSKPLIYDQYNNIYFSGDELFRKTQFQFMAGLDLKINTGRTSAIYIGPRFSYGLSGILKSTNSNSHFINYGLQAGLFFHKK